MPFSSRRANNKKRLPLRLVVHTNPTMNHRTPAAILLISFLLTGCITGPPPVEEIYLSEKTGEQDRRLGDIENEIIKKKKESDEAQDRLRAAEQYIRVASAMARSAEANAALIQEMESLSSIQRNTEKTEKLKKDGVAAKKEADIQKLHVTYREAAAKAARADLAVKRGELAVLVASREHERSRIAAEYQTKRPPAATSKIDPAKYAEFLRMQEQDLKEARNTQSMAAAEVKTAREKFEAAGGKVEE